MKTLESDHKRNPGRPTRKTRNAVPAWFKLFTITVGCLILAKALGLQVLVEVTYDGIPFMAALTDVRTYFIPLLLILIYILSAWAREKFFGPGDL